MAAPTYCTTGDVRAQLGDDSSKLNDALLQAAVNATSRAIDKACGRRFWQDQTPVSRVYITDGSRTVEIDDVATTAGFTVATDLANDGTYSTVWAPSDWLLGPLNADADGDAFAWYTLAAVGLQYFPDVYWPALKVTAQWGWSAIPDDIHQAAVIKATSLFRRKDAPFGVAGFGDFGVVRIGRYDPDVMDLLRPYRKPVIA